MSKRERERVGGLAYKCSETEGGRLETGRERERESLKCRQIGKEERMVDWMNRRLTSGRRVLPMQRDSEINLSYFEFEYVVANRGETV